MAAFTFAPRISVHSVFVGNFSKEKNVLNQTFFPAIVSGKRFGILLKLRLPLTPTHCLFKRQRFTKKQLKTKIKI